LTADEVDQALEAGVRIAELLLRIGLIRSVALSLQGSRRVVGEIRESKMMVASVVERGLVHA
jgi:hypothetical protein